MKKRDRKLILANILCDELKESIAKLQDEIIKRDGFAIAQGERSNTNRIRILLNKTILEITRSD